MQQLQPHLHGLKLKAISLLSKKLSNPPPTCWVLVSVDWGQMWWKMQQLLFKKRSSYRCDVEQKGPALTFIIGEQVIGELVYCWGERKCHGHHTVAAIRRGRRPQPTQWGPKDFMMGVSLKEWAWTTPLVQHTFTECVHHGNNQCDLDSCCIPS